MATFMRLQVYPLVLCVCKHISKKSEKKKLLKSLVFASKRFIFMMLFSDNIKREGLSLCGRKVGHEAKIVPRTQSF